MRAQVPFLGHIISRQGVGVDPAKTEAVEQWPTPTSVKDVRAFLGLASYYRRYIQGFSTVAAKRARGNGSPMDLTPAAFAIVDRPGKHHTHADGLSRRTSRPCKRETCPECRPLQQAVTTNNERARCFTHAFPYQHHFDGYVEMLEEDAALFWRVDTPTDPVLGEESAGQTLESTEATPAEGLCLEATTSPEQARAVNMLTDECSIRKNSRAETAQDTKPAVQSQATNPVVGEEIQGNEIAVPLLRQATTGTQTESGDSLLEAETLNLKETMSEQTSSTQQ